jgi:hypothetical protein
MQFVSSETPEAMRTASRQTIKGICSFSAWFVALAVSGCGSSDRSNATSSLGSATANPGLGGATALGGAVGAGGFRSSAGAPSGGTTQISGQTGGVASSGGNPSTGGTPHATGGDAGAIGGTNATGGFRNSTNVATGGSKAGSSKGASSGGSVTTSSGGSSTKGGAGSGGTSSTLGIGGSGGGGAGTGGTAGSSGPNPTGPCDIYQAANTPCSAAHSTVRALYAAFTGPLYQVQRASDKQTKDIMVGPGGFANSADQDTFCAGTTCTIPIIYDQHPTNGNHLRVTWWAYWLQNGGNPAIATAAKITVGGHTVYGIKSGTNVGYRTGVPLSGTASITKGSATVTFSSAQTLADNTPLLFVANTKDCPADSWPNNCNFKTYYTSSAINAATTVTLTASYTGTSSASTVVWNATTKGIATGDQAEAEYSVFDGKTTNQWCCFDYGNSEIPGVDEGNATMEALILTSCTQFGQSGGGSGPWVAADLENGMYEGYENGSAKVSSNTSITGFPYVTAMLKGLSAKDCPTGLTSSGCFALKAGNATSGKLEWKFSAKNSGYGARPPGYSPQKKQGAIILATGGDGSVSGTGIWFEGAMTLGAPPDATDDAVQANIVAAGYGK